MSESPRVLVIDDEPAICELIEAVAESAGFSVRTASSPAEIEESIQGRFDLVVLDLSLGELDGIEVMSRLGTTHRGLPVILVSGADETLITTAGRIAEMHRLRVIATFAKPFSLDLLRSAMLEWTHVANERIDPTGPRLRIDDEALFDPEFMHLVYQPKVSVSTGDVVGVEALVRWRHPDKGDVSPAAYVALVEDLGRTSELLDAIMTMAAHDRFRYRALASMPDVSLNISVLDLDDDELPRRAQRILTTTSPAESWTFEVTETTPIPDLTPTVAVLTRLRLAGIQARRRRLRHRNEQLRTRAGGAVHRVEDRPRDGEPPRRRRARAGSDGQIGSRGGPLARTARGGRRRGDHRTDAHPAAARLPEGAGLPHQPPGAGRGRAHHCGCARAPRHVPGDAGTGAGHHELVAQLTSRNALLTA